MATHLAPRDILEFALIVHLATIILLLCSLPTPPAVRNGPFKNTEIARFAEKVDIARRASTQFAHYWIGVWAAWAALYLLWFFIARGSAFPEPTSYLLPDMFNLLSGSFFVLCYLIMVLHSVPPPANVNWAQKVTAVFVVSAGILVVEVMLSSGFQVASSPMEIVHGTEGLLVGIAMALFVGRLESGFVHSSRWVVAALYGYAVIQMSWSGLDVKGIANGGPNASDWALRFLLITSIALGLKVLLYTHVHSLVQSGDLTYYMLEYRNLKDEGLKNKQAVLDEILEPPSIAVP
ncbi:MAG: hypothetical protein WB524_22960 [Acidobacteriaceae bacterium]